MSMEPREAEMDEEMRAHIALLIEANVAAGMPAEQARRAALLKFGARDLMRDRYRDGRGRLWLQTLWQDLRFAARAMRRQSLFTLVIVGTLGLGIGANTAMFSVVDAVLLRPLPYAHPDRQVTALAKGNGPVAAATFLAWRTQGQSYDQLAAAEARCAATLTGSGPAEDLKCLTVTPELFALLGIEALRGRTFTAAQARAENGKVVVIGHRLWQRRFGGDPALVGQRLTLGGQRYTVVGIMPPGFEFPLFWVKSPELWFPLDLSERQNDWTGESLRVFGRLKPGVSVADAQAEMTMLSGRLVAQNPGRGAPAPIIVGRLHDKVVAQVRPALWLMLAGVALVLLIACANVANLLLARALARQNEIAIRSSLGASRARLCRQFLTESALWAGFGAAAGLLIAHGGLGLLRVFGPRDVPRIENVALDGRVLGFSLALTILTVVLFGLLPALRLSSSKGARAAGEVRTGRLADTLVVVQVALALVLLIGAGLMMKSFARMRSLDPGFDPDGVLAVSVPLVDVGQESNRARPSDLELARRRALWSGLVAEVARLPGVTSVGGTNHLPIAGDVWAHDYQIVGQPTPAPGEAATAVARISAPGYVRTMGLTLLAGRDFDAGDTPAAPPVALVNETMARLIAGEGSPIGKRIVVADGDGGPREIIGVLKDVRQRDWLKAPGPEMYFAFLQRPTPRALSLVVRTQGDPGAVARALRDKVWDIDRQRPEPRVQAAATLIGEALGTSRFHSALLQIFAGLAGLIAAIGIYGVMAHAVGRRTRELGIRMALGAGRRVVRTMILAEGMRLLACGLAVGLVTALFATRLLARLLYEVSATDPTVFALLTLAFAAIAAVAAYLPARRATRAEPLAVLRQE